MTDLSIITVVAAMHHLTSALDACAELIADYQMGGVSNAYDGIQTVRYEALEAQWKIMEALITGD